MRLTPPSEDDPAGILAGIAFATVDDLMPRVLSDAVIAGRIVSVVECVLPALDGPARRDYLWHAVAGEFELRPARFDDGTPVAGRPYGGTLISTSTVSAHAAMVNARLRLLSGAVR